MVGTKWVCALAVLAVGGLITENAHAALLTLTSTNPDVYADFEYINYNSATSTLTAGGTAESINAGSTTINTGNFALTAVISHSGTNAGNTIASASSGSLSITGDIGSGTQTLFQSSSLQQFGFSTTTDDFNFVFGSNTGVEAPGSSIGVQLHGNGEVSSTYLSTFFSANFGSVDGFSGDSDTFPTPEPASLSLLGVSGLALLVRRRRAK